jgi:hypothetical protein
MPRPARDLWPLLVLLALGTGLRVFLAAVYEPAVLNQFDSATYVGQAEGGLFQSFSAAPGYSLFLRGAHLLSAELSFTIAVQHLLGCAAAALIWWALYSLTGSRWLGLLPAGVILLGGDSLFMEHTVATEALFTFLVVGVVATALMAITTEHRAILLVGSGILLGAAIWVRFAGLALVPVLVIWALFVFRHRLETALAAATAVVAPAAALVVLLVVLQGNQTGFYGLNEASGWGMYSRVAEFADCDEFDPPQGTELLCQPDSAQRRIPDWYGWDPESPARKVFGAPPSGNSELGDWARAAAAAQPFDYVSAVLDDLAMLFVEPEWINSNSSLVGPRGIAFTLRTPDSHCDPGECSTPPSGIENANLTALTESEKGGYYEPFEVSIQGGVDFFGDYQRLVRVHAPLLGLLVLMSLLGLLALSGRLAAAQWLLSCSALALLVFPVATITYNIRYTLPALPLIVAAAALAPLSLRDRAGWIGSSLRSLRARLAHGENGRAST